MKKLERIKLSNYKEILVNKELNQLLGGSDDVNNENEDPGCSCTYNNLRAINNKNSVFGCTCVCV